jgi:hypothetical protein
VVAASLLPWFGRSVDWSDRQTLRFDASAWTASTQWTVALVLAVLAGAGWLVARAVGRLVLVVTRVGEPLPKPQTWLPHVDPHAVYAIHRDRLSVWHNPGFASDVRYGLYLGLLAMGLLALMLLAALATYRARADAAGDG